MANPKSNFKGDEVYSIPCKGEVTVGDEIAFDKAIFNGPFGEEGSEIVGMERIECRVVKESVSADKHIRSFTLLMGDGARKRMNAKNVYRNGTFRKPWPVEADRKPKLVAIPKKIVVNGIWSFDRRCTEIAKLLDECRCYAKSTENKSALAWVSMDFSEEAVTENCYELIEQSGQDHLIEWINSREEKIRQNLTAEGAEQSPRVIRIFAIIAAIKNWAEGWDD